MQPLNQSKGPGPSLPGRVEKNCREVDGRDGGGILCSAGASCALPTGSAGQVRGPRASLVPFKELGLGHFRV